MKVTNHAKKIFHYARPGHSALACGCQCGQRFIFPTQSARLATGSKRLYRPGFQEKSGFYPIRTGTSSYYFYSYGVH
jgi:hypothetical protein